jgi:hypothetical protein
MTLNRRAPGLRNGPSIGGGSETPAIKEKMMNPQMTKNATRRLSSRCLPYVPLAMMLFALTAQAQTDTTLPPIGGPGGNRFVARCQQGEMLSGFDLRAGDDVDAIRPICSPTGTGKYDFYPLSFGGNGGGPRQLVCPGDVPVVTGMYIGYEGKEIFTVNNIHLFCSDAAATRVPSEQADVSFDGAREETSGVLGAFIQVGEQTQRCPGGLVAVGINGRSGDLLDAVGLICGPSPANAKANVPGSDKPPPVALGRVHSTTPAAPLETVAGEPPICAQARTARARNSPAAASLESQCRAASLRDRMVAHGLSANDARNDVAASYVGTHGATPPADHAPPPGASAPADKHTFMPPLFADGTRLWACANAAQGKANGPGCKGSKAGSAYCRTQGFSGALQKRADGTPDLTLGAVRPENKVRASNGDACTTGDCVAISELHCAP